jgi:hypothetical protein
LSKIDGQGFLFGEDEWEGDASPSLRLRRGSLPLRGGILRYTLFAARGMVADAFCLFADCVCKLFHGDGVGLPVTPSDSRAQMRGPLRIPRIQGWPPWRPAYGMDVVSWERPNGRRVRLLDFVKTAEMWCRVGGAGGGRNSKWIEPL